MLIENRYFIPDGLCEAVEAIADRERKTQFVAMLHQDNARTSPGMEGLWAMWADLNTGRNCAWVFGPGRDELISLHPAVLLWIPPMWGRAETPRKRAIREEIDDHSWCEVEA